METLNPFSVDSKSATRDARADIDPSLALRKGRCKCPGGLDEGVTESELSEPTVLIGGRSLRHGCGCTKAARSERGTTEKHGEGQEHKPPSCIDRRSKQLPNLFGKYFTLREPLACATCRYPVGVYSTGMSKPIPLTFFTDDLKQNLGDRLKRVEGQVRGISKMVRDDKPCPEVLHQLNATGAALQGVAALVLRNYLDNCVTAAIRSGDKRRTDDTITELMDVLKRFGQ